MVVLIAAWHLPVLFYLDPDYIQKGVMFDFRLQASIAEGVFKDKQFKLNDINEESGFRSLDPDQEFCT